LKGERFVRRERRIERFDERLSGMAGLGRHLGDKLSEQRQVSWG
jgi:hypothetical protein